MPARHAVALLALLALACTPARREDDDPDATPAVCGNGEIESGETCDGTNVGTATCASQQSGTGTLRCAADCRSFDFSGCSDHCTPACGSRVCGPDPTCGRSCGTCAGATACNAAGACEAVDPTAPHVQSLATNVASISEGQSVTFTAIVTDPDGLADLAGGTLKDGASGSTYGAFAQTAPGAYSITVTWADVNRAKAINFTGTDTRAFSAEFLDSKGKKGGASATVKLTCPGGTHATGKATNGVCSLQCLDGTRLCDGKCVDTASDVNNCGSCAKACVRPSGGSVSCVASRCESSCPSGKVDCNGKCTNLQADPDNCGWCGNACQVEPGWTRWCGNGSCTVQCRQSGYTACSDYFCEATSSLPNASFDICGGTCVSLLQDSKNCGSCGHDCGGDPAAHKHVVCDSGECGSNLLCDAGWFNCGEVCCDHHVYSTCKRVNGVLGCAN